MPSNLNYSVTQLFCDSTPVCFIKLFSLGLSAGLHNAVNISSYLKFSINSIPFFHVENLFLKVFMPNLRYEAVLWFIYDCNLSIYFAVRVQVRNHVIMGLLPVVLPSLPNQFHLQIYGHPADQEKKMPKQVTGS